MFWDAVHFFHDVEKAKKDEVCHRRRARMAWVDVPVGGMAAFRGDVCEVLDVCPTYIFTNTGRIVTDVADVCGAVVVLADPNVSLLAQEVCSTVNRGGGRPLIAVDDTGALSVNLLFLHGLRPVLCCKCPHRLSLKSCETIFFSGVYCNTTICPSAKDPVYPTATSVRLRQC